MKVPSIECDNGSIFDNPVSFDNLLVSGYVNLADSRFKKPFSMESSLCKGGVHFSNVDVYLDYYHTTFEELASFQGTRFNKGLDATELVCNGPLSFKGAFFGGDTLFNNAQFKEQVDFSDVTTNIDSDVFQFNNAIFHGGLILNNSKFSKIEFNPKEFKGPLSFKNATLNMAIFNDLSEQKFANVITNSALGKEEHFKAIIGNEEFDTKDLATLSNIVNV